MTRIDFNGRVTIQAAIGLLSAAGLAGCTGATGLTCDPNTEDCGNIDIQIDGEGDGEAFVSDSVELCDPGNGTLYAIWVDDRREFRDVWFSKSSDGGESWLPTPVQVKQGPGDASNPSLYCNNDRVYVVWEDTRDSEVGYQNIYLNFSNDGGETWRANDRLVDTFDPDGRQISLGPQVVFRGPNVHVVWFDQNEGAPDIYSATSLNSGGEWEEPIRLSGIKLPGSEGGGLDPNEPGSAWSGNPRVTVDDNGIVHAVWEDTVFSSEESGSQEVLYARTTDNTGQQWQPWQRISRAVPFGSIYAFGPRIAVSGDDVYVVWADNRNGAPDVFLLHSADGGQSWPAPNDNPPVRLDPDDTPGANQSRYPELVAVEGVAHVVWQDDERGGYDIYHRAVTGMTPAESADRLDAGDDPGRSNSLRPVIAFGDGQVVAAWQERRVNQEDGFNELMYNHAETEGDEPSWAGSDWRLDTVQGGTSFTRDLNIATFGGEVFAAWTDFRQGEADPDIRFSHTELGTAVITAEDLLQQQPQADATP